MRAPRLRPIAVSPRLQAAALLVLLLVGVVAWTCWSATLAYDFAKPDARNWLRWESQYFPDLVTRLPSGLPRLATGLLFLGSALGLGHLALLPLRLPWRGRGERALLEVAAGLMVWTYVTLALGSTGLLRRAVFLVPLAVGLVAAGWGLQRSGAAARTVRDDPPDVAPGWRGRARLRLVVGVVSAALLVLFLYLELLGALGPEVQFDGRWYHLAQVKHYLQRGCLYNMVAETRISMVGLPAYHQLLLTGVATLFDLRAAKLFPWFEGLLAVLVMICICRHHFGSRLMGLVAALLFLSTPLVGWFTTTSANDLAVGLLSLLAIHVYLRWRAEPEVLSWLVLLGALGGFAAGVKPFALAFLLVLSLGVAVDGLRSGSAGGGARGRWRGMAVRLVTVGAVAVVAVTPWLVRSYMTTGSPTFPFLNGLVFHSPYWNEVVETYYRQAVKSYGVEQTLEWFLRLPVRTVTRANNHRGLIGPLFLVFLPVVAVTIVAARGAAGGLVRRLALYAALVVTLWFGSGLLEIRYVAFVIPALTLLVAFTLVEQSWPGRLGRLLRAILAVVALAVTVLNLQPFVPFQACGTIPGVAGAEPIPWDYLYRGASEESVYLGNLPMVAYVNRHLRPGFDKVYDATSTGSLVIFYLYSDIEVFNGEGWEGPRGLGQWSLGSPDAPWRLGQEGITHVVVHGVRWPRARLKGCAVGAFLHKVWTSPDGLVLYRFDRDAASSAAPGRRVGPDDSALSADGLESGAVRTSAGQ